MVQNQGYEDRKCDRVEWEEIEDLNLMNFNTK